MFKKETIPLSQSGVLNPLVNDYLNGDKKLLPFYNHFPDEEGFRSLIHSHPYSTFDRNTLVEILQKQANSVENTSEHSLNAILKLKSQKSYTVTTGHQLCLFTGPLYFIYKIISTINLAEKLKKQFPDHDFVPVYWMASEDHDFEEVNHFHSSGKTVHWQSKQKGAVGEFDTVELKEFQSQVHAMFGISDGAQFLIQLFEKSYFKHANLADATRYLVNSLFGDKGLVIVDGHDLAFKKQFTSHVVEDFFQNKAFQNVNQSIETLHQLGYTTQVNPRSINCFYHDKGIRSRIEKIGEVFKVVDSSIQFTPQELEQLIQSHPEKISPNVVLRPLYQQVILPNLAYVGGPGELAYWLEFKSFFDHSTVCFPILMPRNFVLFVDKLSVSKMKKIQLSTSDIFKTEQSLIQQLQAQKDALFEVKDEIKSLDELYKKLNERLSAIDSTLIGSVQAEEKKSLNGLERLNKKANRALRRSLETEVRQINELKGSLFPNKMPQERYENFSSFYLSYGNSFLENLHTHLDPFVQKQYIFTEE